MNEEREYIAFQNGERLARGSLAEVALQVAQATAVGSGGEQALVFDAHSSRPVDLDLRGSESDIRQRYSPNLATGQVSPKTRGRGRPKLGVVGREVTLLPRHWEWLGRQPGGASVALRKLIEKARKDANPRDSIRAAQDTSYNFMHAVGGNLQGFEEAVRALYAGDQHRFDSQIEPWPADIRAHLKELSRAAFVVAE